MTAKKTWVQRKIDDLSPAERADFNTAMQAARGLPAHTVSRLVSRHHLGVNYSGCGKKHVFVDLVADGALDEKRDNRIVGGDKKWTRRGLWWGKFLAELRAEPRPKTARQKAADKAKVHAALLDGLDSLCAWAGGPDRLDNAASIVAQDAEAAEATASKQIAEAELRGREARREQRDAHVLRVYAKGHRDRAAEIAKRNDWPESAYFKARYGRFFEDI